MIFGSLHSNSRKLFRICVSVLFAGFWLLIALLSQRSIDELLACSAVKHKLSRLMRDWVRFYNRIRLKSLCERDRFWDKFAQSDQSTSRAKSLISVSRRRCFPWRHHSFGARKVNCGESMICLHLIAWETFKRIHRRKPLRWFVLNENISCIMPGT